MWNHMYGGHFWGMHWIWWGIWIILIIVFIFTPWISRPQKSENSAMDILRERYARGEIDKDEFEERRRILKEK